MLDHALKCYPRESCGILLGTAGSPDTRFVTLALVARNVHPGDQTTSFSIDPSDLFAAIHRARAAGLRVLGFVHSHPDGGVYFSARDLKHAWPSTSNVVIALREGEFAEAGCFRTNEDLSRAEPEELLLPRAPAVRRKAAAASPATGPRRDARQ